MGTVGVNGKGWGYLKAKRMWRCRGEIFRKIPLLGQGGVADNSWTGLDTQRSRVRILHPTPERKSVGESVGFLLLLGLLFGLFGIYKKGLKYCGMGGCRESAVFIGFRKSPAAHF